MADLVNEQYQSNEQTINHFKGAVKGDVAIIFPVVSLINHPAQLFRGSTVENVLDGLLYKSDGTNWVVAGGGGGVEINDTTPSLTEVYSSKKTQDELDLKVNKESGKGLSEENYTTVEKNKLENIADGAEVNVQSDWNVSDNSLDAFIKNKPNIPTTTDELVEGSTNLYFTTARVLAYGSPYCRATGTNTYVATLSPTVTAYPRSLIVSFINENTGASTIKIDTLTALPIKRNGADLVAKNILADQNKLLILSNDNTHYQLQAGTWDLPVVASGEKAMTLKSDGIHVDYDIIDAAGATSTTAVDLAGMDWSAGFVTKTGKAGETRLSNTYKYFCWADNTWYRIQHNLVVTDFLLGSVSDSGTPKTNAEMLVAFPTASEMQIVKGLAGMYMFFGVAGWMYFENKILP